ncbi:MAG TPA: ATP-binding protein [Longimicrobiaceae bacterium]|nr:ATP-binding protein [Longimicrobiaceae bacterium]
MNTEPTQSNEASRLRLILGQMPIVLFSTDTEFRVTYLFGAPLDLLGLHPEELVGTSILDFFTTRDPAHPPITALRRALAGESVSYEVEWGARIFQVHLCPLERNDEVMGAIGAGLDITERKQAEEELRQRELEQKFLADTSAVLASSIDYETTLPKLARLAVPYLADWCIVHFVEPDGRFRRLEVAGHTTEQEQLLQQLADRYPARYEGEEHPIGRVLRTGESVLIEEMSDADFDRISRGPEHLVILKQLGMASAIIVPLASHGKVLGAIAFVRSTTEKTYSAADLAMAEEVARRAAMAVDHARLYKESLETRDRLQSQAAALERAQAEIRTVNDELREANEKLVQRTEEAEHANSAKSAFLATMSHELRTPLNAISGYAEILEMGIRGPVTSAQRDDLARIRHNQEHLLGLINDVLNFAKIEAGQVRYQIVDVELNSLLAGIRELIEPQVKAKKLKYEYRPSQVELMAHADPERTEQIVLNLVTNAIKFTDPGGSVVLTADKDDSRVAIRVQDSGHGISREKKDVIFEPFVQVDPVLTRSNEGTGLGLSISRDLARAMEGDLTVESAPGEGSTFTLVLPASDL